VSVDGPNLLLLGLLLAAALVTVLTADLMKSAIGLAVTSAVLTLLLFRTPRRPACGSAAGSGTSSCRWSWWPPGGCSAAGPST
jgi:hypothetical protein